MIIISDGACVRTIKESPNASRAGYYTFARSACKWDTKGVVLKHSGSHGLCYLVRHADGSEAWYEPDEIMAVLFDLPEQPVDRYELTCWVIDSSGLGVHGISSVRYVYHVNTPWAAYAPNEGQGADLVDDWMVYPSRSGRTMAGVPMASGRIPGWAKINDPRGERFLTEADAMTALVIKLEIDRDRYQADLDRVNGLLLRFKTRSYDLSR